MNVIWIVADTFRQDHLGAYGNREIRTPSLDALAAESVRFDRHYAGGFPTMPTRADHATGRWTMSFMTWEPLPADTTTLAEILATSGFHTAAMVDTPFYLRDGMNYDRGFQTFWAHSGQPPSVIRRMGLWLESADVRRAWCFESDRAVAQTMNKAVEWLEFHYKEDFFLYVDTWDPHEPWDAPDYYTELYLPDYDGEKVHPIYRRWQDVPGYTEARVRKGHATYCGEVTMVDTWIGYLLNAVKNMDLMKNTAIVFTSDHGFYFGEHGGYFGKVTFETLGSDGRLSGWGRSPLYEELTLLPLLVYVPGVEPGVYGGLTSAVDVMPTVLELTGTRVPEGVEGKSLLPKVHDQGLPGREYTVSTLPFANIGDHAISVDHMRRVLVRAPLTTVTLDDWSLLYSQEEGQSELYDLTSDRSQQKNVISSKTKVADDVHLRLVDFMRQTNVPERLLKPRLELRM